MATFGTSALLAGVGITLIAIAQASVPGFFLGNMIAGMGFGAAFQGAIRSVVSRRGGGRTCRRAVDPVHAVVPSRWASLTPSSQGIESSTAAVCS